MRRSPFSQVPHNDCILSELARNFDKLTEKLSKRERLYEEELSKRERVDGEAEALRREVAQLQALTKRQEAAIAKKDKTLQEQASELAETKKIQEAIFNLSKKSATSS